MLRLLQNHHVALIRWLERREIDISLDNRAEARRVDTGVPPAEISPRFIAEARRVDTGAPPADVDILTLPRLTPTYINLPYAQPVAHVNVRAVGEPPARVLLLHRRPIEAQLLREDVPAEMQPRYRRDTAEISPRWRRDIAEDMERRGRTARRAG